MSTLGYFGIGLFLLVVGTLVVIAVVRSRGGTSGADGAGEFDGTFILSFERSSFTPCKQPSVRYWLDWPTEVKLMDELARLGFDSKYAEVHMRFDGTLQTGSANGYGHLGQYSGQVTVSELHSVTRDGRCK